MQENIRLLQYIIAEEGVGDRFYNKCGKFKVRNGIDLVFGNVNPPFPWTQKYNICFVCFILF